MIHRIIRQVVRVLVYVFGYPSQDWPPGRAALNAYDELHTDGKIVDPCIVTHQFLKDPSAGKSCKP